MDTPQTVDVAVIGAGMSGIMAAQQLAARGKSVLVLEKSRGVGGRMATRRIGPGRADTGAQFFTIRSPILSAIAGEWLQNEIIYEWSRGWSDGSLGGERKDGYPRYAVNGGMTGIAKAYREMLVIEQSVKIVRLKNGGGEWLLESANGRRYHSRAVICTPPVPQAIAICDAGNLPLTPADRAALAQISYAPCLCALYWVDGEVNLPPPGALQRPEHPFSWIADNQRKGISPQARLITVHMGPEMSQQYYDTDETTLWNLFDNEMAHHFAPDVVVQERQIKRWRFALPLTTYPERALLAQGLPPLVFAGDAFNGPRVEGAILSGLAAAELVQQQLR